MARPRQFTDEAILEATRCCILEHGPGVSTNMIAERIGMSQAALFKRYGTKEKLLVEALTRPMGRFPFIDLIAQGPSPEPIKDQMIALGVGFMAIMRKVVPCMAMLHAAGIEPHKNSDEDAPSRIIRHELTRWFQTAIDTKRLRPFDAPAIAVAFMGMIHARPFREIIVGDTGLTCSDDEYVTEVVHVLWSGMSLEQNP
jgi:AcrR family transcriptional regulator